MKEEEGLIPAMKAFNLAKQRVKDFNTLTEAIREKKNAKTALEGAE